MVRKELKTHGRGNSGAERAKTHRRGKSSEQKRIILKRHRRGKSTK